MQSIFLTASPTIDLSTPTKSRSKPASRVASGPSVTTGTDQSPSALTRTAVSLEYASLRYPKHCPTGMYVTPSPEKLLIWDAVFFVHQGMSLAQKSPAVSANCNPLLTQTAPGYYADSILKFRITFPPNYPERPPVVQFLTDVFHPLISQQDGTFNLASRFRPWRYGLRVYFKHSWAFSHMHW